jgi:glycosyltransferase involved in cell wall biosynthesis
MKKLYKLYEESTGKISDKWNIYFDAYDNIMAPYRNKAVTMLEIGVQNGGSLEAWSNYFAQAEKIIGCDIDELCGNLTYTDPRISVFVGDATSESTSKKITSFQPDFDIVIDDGSHTSPDIIRAFCKYFGTIKDGGVFIAEDLHCSYWENYEGGIYHPYSSISFFKRLVDIINHEHWGVDRASGSVLDEFKEHYQVDIDNELLSQIHSVEFINSICVVRKKGHEHNILGERYIAGVEESVVVGNKNYHKTFLNSPPQNDNIWSTMLHSPAAEWLEMNERLAVLTARHEQSQHELEQLRTDNNTIQTKCHEVLADNADLHDLLDTANSTASHLQNRVSQLESRIIDLEKQINEIWKSKSWKITKPIRWFFTSLRRAKLLTRLIGPSIRRGGGISSTFRKAVGVYRRDGVAGIRSRLRTVAHHMPSENFVHPTYPILKEQITLPAEKILAPRVLIIGELSIPQCKKYRVLQKQEMFRQRGYECNILDWNDIAGAFEALQRHSVVIFYRVPGFESVMHVISEAKRLNIKTYWDVDDLIFDEEILRNSKTLKGLDSTVLKDLINGATLYRSTMLACDGGIASTPGLAKAMQEAGAKDVVIIENALDNQTMVTADKINNSDVSATKSDEYVRIVYGSGTNTHNIDFEEAAPAIAAVLAKYPNTKFRVIGQLDLPDYLSKYITQIEFFPTCTYEEYLVLLSECDISIAPLENYIFNDSKSNIKYIEASSLHIPSICSPRSAFTQAITHEENGYLCESESEWIHAFSSLIEDKQKRITIGEKAYQNVMSHYSPVSIAQDQVQPFIDHIFTEKRPQTILSVNCYYSPRSFGGATIVAQEINKQLRDSGKIVHVVTAFSDRDIASYQCKRYETDGMNAFGIGIPDNLSSRESFDNQNITSVFKDIVKVTKPDIVHFHCIQGMGVSMLDVCNQFNIPHVVTLHDAWWLSTNQFMIDKNGVYVGQAMIDAERETGNIANKHLHFLREKRVRGTLNTAAAILSPSKYFADFHIANGFKDVILNKNGVLKPKSTEHIRCGSTLRFGYVGGNTEVKGFHLIRKAFTKLTDQNVSLSIVDNTTNLGYSSFTKSDLDFFENTLLVPGYTQANIDDFFANIDVLLFPTQWKESFGLTVREALIRNVWVIVTDAGGVTEDIIEGENGFIIPLEDKGGALLAAINKTLDIYSTRYAQGKVVLPSNNITTFDQQAVELQGIFDGIISAKNPD